MTESKRDLLTQLFDTARTNGAAYLLAIAIQGQMSVQALVDLTGDSDVTVTKYLLRMESRHLVVRVRVGYANQWHLAATVGTAFLSSATKNFGSRPSSSDPDQALPVLPDQIQSEEEEELPKILVAAPEDEAERKIKAYLAEHHYHLTGQHLTDFVADDWITAVDFEMWLHQVAEMQRSGIKIKFPAAYALQCMRKRHLADPKWQPYAERELEMKLRYYEEQP